MPRTLLFLLAFLLTGQAAFGQADFYLKLSSAALELTGQKVSYDPAYFKIAYPGGDVPADKGVCTDVVIRAYRKLGIDLQREVHLDMRKNFQAYPKIWGRSTPDANIDHRRVPNLMVFFARHGQVKPKTKKPEDYLPGDIVCWNLGVNVPHIGLVANIKSKDGKRYLIVHNIGGGQVLADCLFDYKITGHYRYNGKG
ncbi:MAG: DUF1287 domain-containing protein [Elusimicrobiota bacterium]|nr:DUF1287 domain-containing protein [Elusimicrobiota bacterium]